MQGRNKEGKRGVVGQACQKEGERKRDKKKGKKGWGGNRRSKAKKRIEKDEVLVNTLFQCKFSYVKRVKVTWNATLWE
jgi:hypothetical protein